ncbi:MAG: hypothetical protein AB4042_08595, partial [Leptolyngbyaceae cyanobacterium]
METTLRRDVPVRDVPISELRALGTQLQTFANEVHLSIKCTVKDGRLIVLGQHAADAVIHSTTVLRQLERTIQSLHLQFTQQVRLYLRVAGQKQPYAHHRFSLVSPPSHASTAVVSPAPVSPPTVKASAVPASTVPASTVPVSAGQTKDISAKINGQLPTSTTHPPRSPLAKATVEPPPLTPPCKGGGPESPPLCKGGLRGVKPSFGLQNEMCVHRSLAKGERSCQEES